MFSFKLREIKKPSEHKDELTTVTGHNQVSSIFQEAEDGETEQERDQKEDSLKLPLTPLKAYVEENVPNRGVVSKKKTSRDLHPADPIDDGVDEDIKVEDEECNTEKGNDVECIRVDRRQSKEKKEAGLVYEGSGNIHLPPRYIGALAQRALRREMELEIVKERQLKREREETSEQEEHQESFVTGAYKRRLQERKEYEQKMLRKDLEDALNDPRKKRDLTPFHSFMLASGMASRSRGSDTISNEQQKLEEKEHV